DKSASCNVFKYRFFIGKLMFDATTVREDITYPVPVLRRCLSNPNPYAGRTAIRVLKYLK
ncbi:hypothetical protein V1514DRAFT_281816, partial [Lipomyces japonicus]|uniref:uncharacterized protein n=1 Tax=Lipomyces japonicus TaxID=56871 RepID=UPI0034CD484E